MSDLLIKATVILFFCCLLLVMSTTIVYFSWNYVVVDIGGPSITFFQAFMLAFLGRALTGEISLNKNRE